MHIWSKIYCIIIMITLHFSDLKSQVLACIVQLFEFLLCTTLTVHCLLTKPPPVHQLKASLFEAFTHTFTLAITCNNRTFLHQIQ